MNYTILGQHHNIALIDTTEIIDSPQAMLDFIMTVQYETHCEKLIFYKRALPDDFFILSTGIAGEMIQKFINYHIKVAVVGDYSNYTSKPLKDFIYESNHGNDLFFVSTLEDAVKMLELCHH